MNFKYENNMKTTKLCYCMYCQLTHYRNGIQGMNDNDSLGMQFAKLIATLVGVGLKYVCLAWAIAWGIHLSTTL